MFYLLALTYHAPSKKQQQLFDAVWWIQVICNSSHLCCLLGICSLDYVYSENILRWVTKGLYNNIHKFYIHTINTYQYLLFSYLWPLIAGASKTDTSKCFEHYLLITRKLLIFIILHIATGRRITPNAIAG